jgi:hypothetical protein
MLLSSLHSLVLMRRPGVGCWLCNVFSSVFHASGSKGASSHSLFMCAIQLMLFACNSRTSADHETKSATAELPPPVFAHNPNLRKFKFLDFSTNKTRVVADISGGLPWTQVSLSPMATVTDGVSSGSNNGDGQFTLAPQDSVLQTAGRVMAPALPAQGNEQILQANTKEGTSTLMPPTPPQCIIPMLDAHQERRYPIHSY